MRPQNQSGRRLVQHSGQSVRAHAEDHEMQGDGPESNINYPPTKRPRMETSRAAMSYPRKRAVTACQLCRARKTKCSNTRPKCKFCTDTGADCVYGDSLDHSSFDPASLLMLERLNQIIERLDRSAEYPPAQAVPTPVSAMADPPVNTSHPEMEEGEEYMRIPSSRTTADTILLWPIFQGRYAPNLLLQPLFKDGVESEEEEEEFGSQNARSNLHQRQANRTSLAHGTVEDNAVRLVDNFLATVHTKNPILDVKTLRKHARQIAEDGPKWDGKSCIVLLACALGSVAKPFSKSEPDLSQLQLDGPTNSLTHSLHDLQIGEYYYGMARKRIGLLSSTITRSQCYLLSGIYLMYVLRPLEAWQNFLQASTTYYIYLQGRMQLSEIGGQLSNKTRKLEQRLFWTCFKSECEIRVEMSFPESSITNLRYPDMFPSPPNEKIIGNESAIVASTPFSDYDTPSSSGDMAAFQQRRESHDNNQQQSWYYYITDIALRRIGNRILNALYKHGDVPGAEIPLPEMFRIATDFESQLLRWQSTLPEILYYNHQDPCDIPTEELPYMVRARSIEIQNWLYLPFLYYAVHHPADDPYQQLIQPFAAKAFEISSGYIHGLRVTHRHHGTWYAVRHATVAAFIIIAAVKCGHINVPATWLDTVEMHLAALRYWEAESPDLAQASVVLVQMLEEL